VDLKLVPIGWEENKEKDKTGRIRAATVGDCFNVSQDLRHSNNKL